MVRMYLQPDKVKGLNRKTGERKKLKRFEGTDCFDQFAAWNQRRQLKGEL